MDAGGDSWSHGESALSLGLLAEHRGWLGGHCAVTCRAWLEPASVALLWRKMGHVGLLCKLSKVDTRISSSLGEPAWSPTWDAELWLYSRSP